MSYEPGYYCDELRHIVCVPYSVPGLHDMAFRLGIKRCWFHPANGRAHYDTPKRRIAELTAKCTLVSGRDVLAIMKGAR